MKERMDPAQIKAIEATAMRIFHAGPIWTVDHQPGLIFRRAEKDLPEVVPMEVWFYLRGVNFGIEFERAESLRRYP